jgi:hypothetical protein
MRKFVLMLVAAGALLVPLAALADETPAPVTVANQICSQEKTAMGAAAFKLLYGTNTNKSNAHGKCVSKNAAGAEKNVANAAKTCKAERTADAAAFAGKYGTNPNNKNAFGKCVSALAKTAAHEEASKTSSAAKSCKAELAADRTAFATKYSSARNAFGKCVSASKHGE